MLNENHLIRDNIKNFRLLTESVDQKSIVDAIESNNIVYIYYQGDNTKEQYRGYRTIEPYALGTSAGENSNKTLLRAWEQAGKSQSAKKRPETMVKGGSLENRGGWRLFDVAGISSWLPVNGKNSKFLIQRPYFNPNDKQMSSIIAAHDLSMVSLDTTKGQGSIEEPNFQSKEVSAFNNQAAGLKSFTQDLNNTQDLNDFQYKKNIVHLFGKEKWSGNRNPANFYVVRNKNGNLENKLIRIVKSDIESGIMNSNDVIGNLDDLFKKISGLQDTNKVSKGAFEKYQNDLNDSSSLLGGQSSRPIDNSFFNKQKLEFERNLQN